MDNPIYIVAGFARSGTTMMMNCLRAGGIPLDDNLEDNLEFGGFRYKRLLAQLWDRGRWESLRGVEGKAAWH